MTDYIDYMSSSPRTDGEEIRAFFDEQAEATRTKMTNEEAIEILRQIPQRYFYGRRVNGKQITIEALDLAIKALKEQERPTGEWIEGTQGFYCSKCDYYDRDYFEHNFCPNCGVTIKGVERWD